MFMVTKISWLCMMKKYFEFDAHKYFLSGLRILHNSLPPWHHDGKKKKNTIQALREHLEISAILTFIISVVV